MRSSRFVLLPLLILFAGVVHADEPMCGTSPEHDAWLRSVLDRPRETGRIAAHGAPAPLLRNGAIYLQSDDAILRGNRPFNLDEQSLVFEPVGPTTFSVRREPLRYIEPAGAPVHDFEDVESTYERELAVPLSLFGRTFSRIYATRFNAVHFEPPQSDPATWFVSELDAAVQRGPVVSPLMITSAKPRQLAYPVLYVDETPAGVVLTWRSTKGDAFGYDVQAELRANGTIVLSYRTPRNIRWGTPVVSPGLDSFAAAREVLASGADFEGDVSSTVNPLVDRMLDIVSVEAARVDGTDLLSVRVKLAAPVTPAYLAPGQRAIYSLSTGRDATAIEFTRDATEIRPFGSSFRVPPGQTIRIDGNAIEFFALQPAHSIETRFDVKTTVVGTNANDVFGVNVKLAPPSRRIGADLAAIEAPVELALPVAQSFVLGTFDPWVAWSRVQNAFPISNYDVDAVAIYQTFFTDLIFYAGAYATGGNAQVNGIRPNGTKPPADLARTPTLLNMNQLTYNYSSKPRTASRVLLHELGHRWLYFFRINENGKTSTALNPTSAHPAGYVHTPAAFSVYEEEESSVMGGGFFRPESAGSWRTVAKNDGFSWTDLYLMGLASPEEVAPWFYLANTTPALPKAYWPPHDISVTGDRKDVAVSQIIDVHGPRSPSSATSQRQFRVLFVLVTEPGREPTAEEMAKMDEWRALLARNFSIATGGRGSIVPTWTQPTKRRGVR